MVQESDTGRTAYLRAYTDRHGWRAPGIRPDSCAPTWRALPRPGGTMVPRARHGGLHERDAREVRLDHRGVRLHRGRPGLGALSYAAGPGARRDARRLDGDVRRLAVAQLLLLRSESDVRAKRDAPDSSAVPADVRGAGADRRGPQSAPTRHPRHRRRLAHPLRPALDPHGR